MGMLKCGKKGVVVEDGDEFKIELEFKKSKMVVKKNDKEVVGEGLVLYEDFFD